MSDVTADAPTTSTCVRCENPLQSGAAFCRLCGTQVAGRVIAPPEPSVPRSGVEEPRVDQTPSIFDGVRPAELSVRTAAWMLDVSVVVVAVFAIVVVSRVTGVPEVLLVTGPVTVAALWIWFVVWHALAGNSFGKLALGLRLVSSRNLTAPGLPAALVRSLVVLVSAGVVHVSIALDGSGWRRGWHDKAASTVVIDVMNGVNPLGPRVVAAVLRRPDRGLRSIESPVPLRTAPPPPPPPPPPPVAET